MPIGFLLKGWALFEPNGSLTKGKNIASVVRNSAGYYTVTFSTPMTTALYFCKVHLICAFSNTIKSVTFFQSTRTTGAACLSSICDGMANDCGFYVEFWE